MNLCLLPNVDLKTSKQEVDEKCVGKFDKWLNTSPYGIWVTKFAAKQPHAECKYRHCCQKFNYDLNSTSSNIIKHLKRHHKLDYDLFSKKFLNSHRALASFSNVLSPQWKPFPLRKELIAFSWTYKSKLRQLNFFVATIAPFSAAETLDSKKLLTVADARNGNFVYSCKSRVRLLGLYHQGVEIQLEETLTPSASVNIPLDIRSSADNRSSLAVLVSFCPDMNQGTNILTNTSASFPPNMECLLWVMLELF